jgi:hypothetical protein
MVFWLAIAVTAASLIVSFVWTQKTLPIRLALLALGLIGIGLAADRYFEDQKKAQQTAEYWEVARLNVSGTHFTGGDLQEHTQWNDIIGAHIHDRSGKAVWDCDPLALDAYTQLIQLDPKFPFPYFFRASCNHLGNTGEWQKDIEAAQTILRITTQIPGHNQNHDEILSMIDRGDLGRKPS